jgi:hypothetical protein
MVLHASNVGVHKMDSMWLLYAAQDTHGCQISMPEVWTAGKYGLQS